MAVKRTTGVIVTAICVTLVGCNTLSKAPHVRAWEQAEIDQAQAEYKQARAKQQKRDQEERSLLERSQMTSWQLQQQTATEVVQRAALKREEYARERAQKQEQGRKQAEQERLLALARAEHEQERARKLETARTKYELTLTLAERQRERMRAQMVERELVRVLDKGGGLEAARKRAPELARELAQLDPKQARALAHALSAELEVAYDLELWHLLSGRERLDYKRGLELKRTLLRSRVLEGY